VSHLTNIVLQSFYHRLPEWVAVVCLSALAFRASHLRGISFTKIFFPTLFLAFIAGLVPLLAILMVSNGAVNILDLRWAGGWADMWALTCDFLIACFLVVLPHSLHKGLISRQAHLTDVEKENLALLPNWLATAAGAATFALIFTLHFIKGGQLTHFNLWLVVAAGIGIVTLLLPFYGALARACLLRGFTPWQWLKGQLTALGVIWVLTRPKPAAAPVAADVPAQEETGVRNPSLS